MHYIWVLVLEARTVMSFILFLIALYWLPTLIAIVRQTQSALGIAMLNCFFGWTVIGWIVALVWALAAAPRMIMVIEGRARP